MAQRLRKFQPAPFMGIGHGGVVLGLSLRDRFQAMVDQDLVEDLRAAVPPSSQEGESAAPDIHSAAKAGAVEELRAMIAAGADCNASDYCGHTALFLAAQSGHPAAVRTLVEAGAHVDFPNRHGLSPLHAACSEGHALCAQALLDGGARLDIEDSLGRTPLHIACLEGFEHVCATLFNAGARGLTPLLIATAKGHTRCVEILSGR
mmetsp:Transcript_21647/g.52111  ORF Transcript_21647/g.52111 Transcript_21647/m.52111 type:complete len:205 (-) Transcript_21647:266-880(-)